MFTCSTAEVSYHEKNFNVNLSTHFRDFSVWYLVSHSPGCNGIPHILQNHLVSQSLFFKQNLHLLLGILSVLERGGDCKITCSFLFHQDHTEGLWLEFILGVLPLKFWRGYLMMKSKQVTEELQVSLSVEWHVWIVYRKWRKASVLEGV